MKTLKEFLLEDKTRLINKLDLTPDQKEEAIAFFKKHPQREKEIDWNRKDLTWSDLEKILHGTTTKSKLKQVRSISGMKEGKDYIELETGLEDWYAYVPLHHQASRAIASSRIGGVEGKWCIAQNDDGQWKGYIYDRALIPIYLINYIEEDKFALMLHQGDFSFHSIWDSTDDDNTIEGLRLKDSISKKISSQRSKLEKAKEVLTENKPLSWFDKGLKDSTIVIEDAEYIFVNVATGQIWWKSGIWKKGTWEGGIWKGGTWETGTWKDGIWKKGTWETGTWLGGTWEWGEWEGGTWKNGIWSGGTWKKGTWEGGTWFGGTWLGGYDKTGKFHPEGDSPNRW